MTPPAFDEALLLQTFAACRFHHTMRMALEIVAPGHVRVRQKWGEDLDQAMGRVHGGVYAALLDASSYYAALSACPAGEELPLTQEYKINLLASAKQEDLVAESSLVKLGRRVVVVETKISTASGVAVAIGLTSLVRG